MQLHNDEFYLIINVLHTLNKNIKLMTIKYDLLSNSVDNMI